jgi:hypothetical protein
MSFICPRCKQYTLEIKKIAKAVLGPMDDEKSIQLVGCSCGFKGVAVYEESRRGAGSVFNHDGYMVPDELVDKLKEKMVGGGEVAADDFTINKITQQKFDHFSMDLAS